VAGNWLSGKKVLISPQWIENVSWTEQEVYVNVSRAKIEHSDDYDESTPIDRDYELSLYQNYGQLCGGEKFELRKYDSDCP
jgi:poly-D-alanine transfer protein DltD